MTVVSGSLAVRAVVFEPRVAGEAAGEASAAGLSAWLGGGGGGSARVRLRLVEQARLGLLVQRLNGETVEVVWSPRLVVEARLGYRVCRFHEGPRGEPWRHRYCRSPAVTRDGYCRLHAHSAKALYERCAQGVDAACREAARLLEGEEFSVYVLDYGGGKAKAGLTQSWRLLYRLAEQPHVAAAEVARLGLLEARELEKKLGRMKTATEGAGERLERRLRAAAEALERLEPERAAARLASMLSMLGLRGSYEAYTVLPSGAPASVFARAPRLRGLEEIMGREAVVEGYWAGLLLLRLPGGGLAALPRRLLLHEALRARIAGE